MGKFDTTGVETRAWLKDLTEDWHKVNGERTANCRALDRTAEKEKYRRSKGETECSEP